MNKYSIGEMANVVLKNNDTEEIILQTEMMITNIQTNFVNIEKKKPTYQITKDNELYSSLLNYLGEILNVDSDFGNGIITKERFQVLLHNSDSIHLIKID